MNLNKGIQAPTTFFRWQRLAVSLALFMAAALAQSFDSFEFRRHLGNETAATVLNLTDLTLNGTSSKNVTVIPRAEASYPADLMTYEQIKKGGFIVYLIGKWI